MLEVKKSAIRFDSASGADTVAGYFYEQPGTAPRAIVQLSHVNMWAAMMISQGFL